MSTNWYWYCMDCQDEGPLELNHGEHDLKELWGLRDKIAAAASVETDGLPGGLEFKIERYATAFPSWWVVQHKDHNVRIRNEYNQFFGDCGKRFECECCGTQVWCNQPDAHDGACKRTKPG